MALSFITRRTVSGGALAVALAVGAVSPISSEPASGDTPQASRHDMPMFGGTPSRNMVNLVEKNLPVDWSVQEGQQKHVRWSAKLGTKAYGGPVIADGKVFVATNNGDPRGPKIKGDKGIVMCFRESDGRFVWQAVHDSLPDRIVKDARPEGIASTPTVEGKRLYYVSNRCELVCADTEGNPDGTAKFIWKLDMIEKLGVFPHKLPNCSPLLVGDLLFVTTGNGVDEEQVAAPKAPSFIAVDKKTGEVKWQDNSPGENIMLGQWSNPAYAVVNGKPQVIFGGGDGWLRAFEPETGKPIWKFDCNPKGARGKKGTKGPSYLVATPVVYENRVYVGTGQEPSLGSGPAHFWCVDITKAGDLSPRDDKLDPKAEANKDSGLVWHYGGSADEKTAEETSRDYLFGRTVSTCAIADGLVYVAELAGYLHCLDARTGHKYWVTDLKADVWGSPYWADGKVYIGTGDSEVRVFAHGKVLKELAKVDMEDIVNSTPAAANGVLYVMTMKKLYAIR